MLTSCQIGVASSVSAACGFDPLNALSYTIDHTFEVFQPFLNPQLATDGPLRRQIRTLCQQHEVALVAHAPATLSRSSLLQYPIHTAITDLFWSSAAPLVVHHYDETISAQESLACLQTVHEQGLLPCLENYFIRGAATSETCFHAYLHLLLQAKSAGIPIRPVFDIPRLYHQRVHLQHQALPLIDQAFRVFASLETPILLHLIDIHDFAQERASWCPIGQGLIPYTLIFEQLLRYQIPVSHIILEYEEKINPLESRAFLKQQLIRQLS